MRIKEMITALRALQDQHGNAEVVVFVEAVDRRQNVYAVVVDDSESGEERKALILLDED